MLLGLLEGTVLIDLKRVRSRPIPPYICQISADLRS